MTGFLKIFDFLSSFKSPSGFERELSKGISSLAEKYADEITTDTLGNLIVHKKGAGKRLMLLAHMDTTGLLATHIDENGFIRFGALGSISPEALQNVPVEFLNGLSGVVSYDENTDKKDRKLEHFYIDIGAETKKQASALVKPGDAAVFSDRRRMLGKNTICSPYLENRIGCGLLLNTISRLTEYNYDLYFVFSVLDETGLRGSKTAAYSVKPDFALSIGVTLAGDTPEHKSATDMKLGAGAGIKVMDKSVIAHPEIVSALSETAARNKISCQKDIVTAYGTSAGPIHLTRGGIKTGGISVPIRYRHTQCEVADLRDIEAADTLLYSAITQTSFL